jgi:hypothetical protein
MYALYSSHYLFVGLVYLLFTSLFALSFLYFLSLTLTPSLSSHLFLSVSLSLCIYIYVHTHINIYIHTYIYIYISSPQSGPHKDQMIFSGEFSLQLPTPVSRLRQESSQL